MGELDFTTIGALIVGGGIGAMLAMVRFQFAMVVFVGMMLASALAAPTDWRGMPVQTWMMPLQQRRSEIFALCGALLAASMIFHIPRVRFGSVPMQGLFLLLIALYAAFVRMVASNDPFDGVLSLGFALLTILPAIIILPSLMRDREDIMHGLRLIALLSVLWAMMCAVQFVVRPRVLTLGGGYTRFQGMLANPQHAGALLSVFGTVCLFLILNETKQRWRPLWIIMAAVNLVLLLWTGSRTGMGMFAIGSVAVLYTRLGSAVLLLPIAGGVFFVAYDFLSDQLGEAMARVGDTSVDTRTVVWTKLIDQFRENPAFGIGSAQEATASENSILFGLASYGVGMGIILVLFIFASLIQVMRVFAARWRLEPLERRMADLFIGFNGMYFAGAMLEGYMISRVSAPMVFMMFFAAVGVRVLEISRTSAAEEDDPERWRHWDEQAGEEYEAYADYYADDQPALGDTARR